GRSHPRQDLHDLHHPVLHLENLDRVIGEDDARAGLGNRLELLQQQAIDRLRPLERELEPRLAIEYAQRARAVGDHAAAWLAMEKRAAADRLAGELADDLLEDVLHRDEPE